MCPWEANPFHCHVQPQLLDRRIIEWLGLEGTSKIIRSQPPCRRHGCQLLDQALDVFIIISFKNKKVKSWPKANNRNLFFFPSEKIKSTFNCCMKTRWQCWPVSWSNRKRKTVTQSEDKVCIVPGTLHFEHSLHLWPLSNAEQGVYLFFNVWFFILTEY